MYFRFTFKSVLLFVLTAFIFSSSVQAQVDSSRVQFPANSDGGMIFLFILLIIVLLAAIFLKIKTSEAIMAGKRKKAETDATNLNQYINSMT